MNSTGPARALGKASPARITPPSPPRLKRPQLLRLFCNKTQPGALRRPHIQPRADKWPPVYRIQRHSFTTVLNRAEIKKTWKEHPILFPVVLLLVTASMVLSISLVYKAKVRAIDNLKAFPEPVAKHLRRALYYTNESLNPQKALQNYQKAILVADDINMDPFSPEILGVKIQVAAFYETLGLYQNAIGVLEQVRGDCLKWNEYFGDKPQNAEKRSRLLLNAVQMSVKLGEYYGHETIRDLDAAEAKMVWAVTTILEEQQRRQDAGLKPEDLGGWISEDQMGATFEGLANHFARASIHHLSAPLYLRAMSLSPPKSCHTVILMNNLAIALALQNPPSTPNQPGPSATDQISSGRVWANKALALAASITPPERDEECDQGCVAATIALGDFAEMEGDIQGARRRWEEGKGLSRGMGFKDGEREAMKRLNEATAGKTAEEIESEIRKLNRAAVGKASEIESGIRKFK